jgi:hypothetical protein
MDEPTPTAETILGSCDTAPAIMRGKKQMDRHRIVHAPPEFVYALFMDNAELHKWVPPVNKVLSESGGDDTGLGRTRTCDVTMQGKRGTMVEECVEAVAGTRASFLVVEDSFGFQRMLTDYGFTVTFSEAPGGALVRIETYYTPANIVARAMNVLMMRRTFRRIVDAMLDGLRTLAEQRYETAQ